MANLPARRKVIVACFRRVEPDEILVVEREARRALQWSLPSDEAATGEHPREAALRLVGRVAHGEPGAPIELGVGASYRVNAGPRAGAWTEHFFGVEMPPDSRAREGAWLVHYEAKAQAGADAPRVREALTRLRDVARLKP